ncbi:MAG: hypothetical protein FWE07_06560 [Turicibacter sp.]|nr:hypothetical protein [Turicibacter sp.]
MTDAQNVKKAFQSILRSDYISIDDPEQLQKLEDYYVDTFNNLPIFLSNQDNFVTGRRGTGKTTLLMRAYYECLKSITSKKASASRYLGADRVLPIYIDLSQCKEIFEEENEEKIERTFISEIVTELKRQLSKMFDSEPFKILKKDNSKLEEFDEILHILKHGVELKSGISKEIEQSRLGTKESYSGSISKKGIQLSAGHDRVTELTAVRNIEKISGISVQNFLDTLNTVRIKSKIDSIYIFVDEFSDLSVSEQEKFSSLLKKLLGSKNNIFFKIGTITSRYDFGKNILIGRDIFPVSLDLNDFVERYDGIVGAIKALENFTSNLIESRLNSFNPELTFDKIFTGNQDIIIQRITRASMGVPRTVGLILQNAIAELNNADSKIRLNDINLGMRATRKIYMQQFQGAIKKRIIPGFHMDMWNSILGRALDEKNKKGARPASHFMLDSSRSKYLEVLRENFVIHLLEENRSSKSGGNYFLYALDYDICMDNNIPYAETKDEFTAVRFIYDAVMAEYDAYFAKDSLKSYSCSGCNVVYPEKDVAMMKTKRCFECDEKLDEIIHREVSIREGNYTEVEIKILGLIASLDKDAAMSASEISEFVGCSVQKVSLWCTKVAHRKRLISIDKTEKNLYYNNEDSD